MDPDETHEDPWEQLTLPGMDARTQYSTYSSGIGVTTKMDKAGYYATAGGHGSGGRPSPGTTFTSGPLLSESRLRETLNEILKERVDSFFQQVMDRLDQIEDRLS